MFTGIIEGIGVVEKLYKSRDGNLHLTIKTSFAPELVPGQSVAHNGVCLTVTDIDKTTYTTTAIKETLSRTNLGQIKKGNTVNLERCMKADGRFDGHIVQGHVDCTAVVKSILSEKGRSLPPSPSKGRGEGSWTITFSTKAGPSTDREVSNLIVEKGSVCINGVSLTVAACHKSVFSVAVIPYTYQHTNFHAVKEGALVNIEFDIIGKYVAKMLRK